MRAVRRRDRHVQHNGTYITRERLEQARSVLSRIIVSMDGASPETFNVLRKPSEFDDVCARLDVLKAWREELTPDQRPFVHIHGTLTLQWVDELSEMVRLAARYGVDELTIGYLIAASDYWRAQQPSNEPERVDAALREASATAQELGVSVSLPKLFGSGESVSVSAGSAMPVESRVDVPPAPTGGPKYWCKYLWRELFIQQGGEVAPCCGQGRPDVDNVNRNPDLQSIFNDPVLQEMRNGMTTGDLHPACAQCNLLSQYGDLGYAEASFEGDYTTLNGMLAEQQKRGRES